MAIKAKYGVKFWAYMIFGTVFTAGLFVLLVLHMRTMWLNRIGDFGVSTVTGRSYIWSDLTGIENTKAYISSPEADATTLLFGNKRVIVNNRLLSNHREINDCLNTVLDRM